MARLEKAFPLVTAVDGIARSMRAARVRDWRDAVKRGVITPPEGEKLRPDEAVAKVVEVDDFAPDALSTINSKVVRRSIVPNW